MWHGNLNQLFTCAGLQNLVSSRKGPFSPVPHLSHRPSTCVRSAGSAGCGVDRGMVLSSNMVGELPSTAISFYLVHAAQTLFECRE